MASVKQPSSTPTNKLTAAVVAGAVWELGSGYVASGLEAVGMSLGPNVKMMIMFGLMAVAGYFIKDKPNKGAS